MILRIRVGRKLAAPSLFNWIPNTGKAPDCKEVLARLKLIKSLAHKRVIAKWWRDRE